MSPFKSLFSTRMDGVNVGRQSRIKIPQPDWKPLIIQETKVVTTKFEKDEVFLLHRRGVYRRPSEIDPLEERAVSKSSIRGTLPERIVYRLLVQMHFVPDIDFDFQSCVGSHHKILTSDMRWVEAGTLKPGDELLSFTEFGSPNRKWTKGKVLYNKVELMESYKVLLSDGKEIITTGNHPWLIHYSTEKHDWGKGTGYNWVETKDLKVGAFVPIFLETWEQDTSYEAGWVAGFFDGEGSVVHHKTRTGGHALGLTVGQNKSPMLDKFNSYLSKVGFEFTNYDYTNKYKKSYDDGLREVVHCRIMGGRSESLRFLGTIRPSKLAYLDHERLGKLTKIRNVQIVSIKPNGLYPIARLEVDTHTYLVEGFGMHNSLQGGRAELGGIVADFLFPYLMLIIQVQGPTHTQFLRTRKDEEQRGILEAMGFRVEEIDDVVIYDEYRINNELRRIFNMGGTVGGGSYGSGATYENRHISHDGWLNIADRVDAVYNSLSDYYARII